MFFKINNSGFALFKTTDVEKVQNRKNEVRWPPLYAIEVRDTAMNQTDQVFNTFNIGSTFK